MRYFFYCPNCGFEEVVSTIPKGTVPNLRDGYGTPIRHYECQKCHNLDAGYMQMSLGKMVELSDDVQKRYFRETIVMYQGIRGIKD